MDGPLIESGVGWSGRDLYVWTQGPVAGVGLLSCLRGSPMLWSPVVTVDSVGSVGVGSKKRVREESEKAGGDSVQKPKVMASGPITSWQIEGETMETVRDFLSLTRKSLPTVTTAIKRKKHGQRIKSKDITLAIKVHIVKVVVFPVVTYRCKSWTIKKAEH